MWAVQIDPPTALQARYNRLTEFGAVLDDIEADQKRSDEDKKKPKEKDEKKPKEGNRDGKQKQLRVPQDTWNRRRRTGLCPRCGSNKHRKGETKCELSLTDPKDQNQSDGKNKSVGAVNAPAQPQPEAPKEQVSAIRTGKIYDSDQDDNLDLWSSDQE